MKTYNTKYYGIWVVYEEGFGWSIEDAHGNGRDYDHRPTEHDIEQYRDEVVI